MLRRDAWRDLRAEWSGCRLCPALCDHTKVFGRGQYDPDVCFLGIGPGDVEDMEGIPFVGPAGKLLDRARDAALVRAHRHLTFFYLNLVLCRPVDSKGNNRDPTPTEIENCEPRLRTAMQVVNPKQIILLGRLVMTHAPTFRVPTYDAWHPAYVVREESRFSEYVERLTDIFKRSV